MTRFYVGATRAHIREAVRLGRRAGAAAFHPQYLPGGGRDTARDPAGRAAALLAADNEGRTDALLPPQWLSGEWADEPLPVAVARECGVTPARDPDGIAGEEVCDAYCAAADSAYRDAVLSYLRAVAQGGQ